MTATRLGSLALALVMSGPVACDGKTSAPTQARPSEITVRGAKVSAAVFDAAAPMVGKLAVCTSCHGQNGLGDGDAGAAADGGAPALAGLTAMYLTLQLRAYRLGERAHPDMTQVARLLAPSDVSAMATHYAGLPTPPLAPGDDTTPTIARGRAIAEGGIPEKGVPACSTCHMPRGVGNAAFPRLAGQNPAYQIAQMEAFRGGARKTQQAGVMKPIAAKLTPEEVAAVSAYYAAQVARPTDPVAPAGTP